MMRALLSVLLVLLPPLTAQAYSDPALFDEPADRAGGGGRLFTGSPQDGYSCSVCHRGGKPPELNLRGLPTTFVPGKLYQVRLSWDGQAASHALHLELVNKRGEHPNVSIEPESVIDADGRCDADPTGDPANYSIDREQRRVIGIRDCGANRVSLQFTAPDEAELYFAASLVRTDSSGTAEGDGVLDVRHVLRRQGDDAASGGCALHERPTDSAGLLLLLTLGAALQRRLRPRSRVASTA